MDLEALRRALLDASFPQWWLDLEPGLQLRTLREELDVSQRQLSDTSGVRQATISRLENGGDAKLAVWKRLFGAIGYDFAVAACNAWEDMHDLQEHERRRRVDKQLETRFTWRGGPGRWGGGGSGG